jgi:16S rRNA processing protein RimM
MTAIIKHPPAKAMADRKIPPEDYLAVGEILGTYGVHGAVWVKPFAAGQGRNFSNVVLTRDGESAPATVTALRKVGERWIVTLAGTASCEDAAGLKGWLMSIPIQDIPALPEGSFYVHEIIGRTVLAEDGRNLGNVVDVITTGTNDVYVIDGPEGELLFPALRDLVLDCPRGGDTLRIRIPPGLLESCLTRKS